MVVPIRVLFQPGVPAMEFTTMNQPVNVLRNPAQQWHLHTPDRVPVFTSGSFNRLHPGTSVPEPRLRSGHARPQRSSSSKWPLRVVARRALAARFAFRRCPHAFSASRCRRPDPATADGRVGGSRLDVPTSAELVGVVAQVATNAAEALRLIILDIDIAGAERAAMAAGVSAWTKFRSLPGCASSPRPVRKRPTPS